MRRASVMRRLRAAGVTAVALAVAAASAGCVPASQYHEPHLAPGATDPSGVDATAAALAGEWAGHYDAPIYARRGALRLSLRPVAQSATGATQAATVTGTATFAGIASPVVVDSARVTPGRVVLWLQPLAVQASGATLWVRLDGALAADTLGGHLRADAAATATSEHHGGWYVTRVAPSAMASAVRAP